MRKWGLELTLLLFLGAGCESTVGGSESSTLSSDLDATATPTPTGTPTSNFNSGMWISAYLPSWELNVPGTNANWGGYTLEEIDWSAFSHLIFFATGINADGTCCDASKPNANWNETRLHTIVSAAHSRGKPVLFSVGGAGSSAWYSALSDSETRATTVNNLVNFMLAYEFDGIDLDPEESSSWAQYIGQFSLELRNKMNQSHAFYDASTKPILTAAIYNNASSWAAASASFDQLNVMSYDMMGTWHGELWHNNAAKNVRNADGSCATADIAEGNGNTCMATIESKINDYLAKGIPRDKLGGGIDFNGWVWKGGLNQAGTNGVLHPRERWQSAPSPMSVTLNSGACSTGGNVESRYAAIRKCYIDQYPQNLLWDSLSQVSYMSFDNDGNTNDIYVTYQNAESVKNGVRVIKSKAIGGMILWEIGGGYLGRNNFPDSQYSNLMRDELLQAVKQAMQEP